MSSSQAFQSCDSCGIRCAFELKRVDGQGLCPDCAKPGISLWPKRPRVLDKVFAPFRFFLKHGTLIALGLCLPGLSLLCYGLFSGWTWGQWRLCFNPETNSGILAWLSLFPLLVLLLSAWETLKALIASD